MFPEVLRCFSICAIGLTLTFVAQAHVSVLRQESGALAGELDIPPNAIRAALSAELFIRILRADDSPTVGIACRDLSVSISMPGMRSMPAIIPAVRPLGYAGTYALRVVFPHGGTFRVDVSASPIDEPKAFSFSYWLDVLDADGEPGTSAKPFRLEVQDSNDLHQKRPAELSLSVWNTDTNARVSAFDVVHERKLHAFLVRADLSEFFHEHPLPEPDGTFRLQFRFPSAGKWILFADVAPAGAGSQILSLPLWVAGKQTSPHKFQPSVLPVVQSGVTVSAVPTLLVAHQTQLLTLQLKDAAGNVPEGLEPWLAAPGHLMIIEQDASTFVHSHPAETSTASDGVLNFEVRFPKPGLYKAWLQVRRHDTVLTFPFALTVSNPEK